MRIIQFYFQKIRAQHILVSGGSSDRAQDSMTSNDKFCLKWNDFRENLTDSFNKLREDCEFSDVTLVCEENQQIEAHRVILSACSPFFSSVLKKNKHSHPMIYRVVLLTGPPLNFLSSGSHANLARNFSKYQQLQGDFVLTKFRGGPV